MNVSNIALRNLSRQKRRSLLLAGAIAFGIMIVTAVNGFSAGTIRIMKENVADLIGGHVFVNLEQRVDGKTVTVIEDDSKIVDILHGMGVKDSQIHRTVNLRGELINAGWRTTSMVVGLDWKDRSDHGASLGLDDAALKALEDDPSGVVISRKTADTLHVDVGDGLIVKGKTVYGSETAGDFTVRHITDDKSDISAMMAFGSSSYLADLLALPSESAYETMRIQLGSLDETTAFSLILKEKIKAVYPLKPADTSMMNMNMDTNVFQMGQAEDDFEGLRADVQDVNSMLDFINQASGGLALASFVLLVFLLLIIMVGIANTFRMILYERTREIGTMRAVGMFRKDVRNLFLLEALFLALVGVAMGVALAFVLMWGLGFIDFGTESAFSMLLQHGHLFFQLDIGSLLISTLLVAVFTLLAARGPAKKAARLAPADALRTNY